MIMHILFISQYFYPEIGAASERFTGFAVNSALAGHKVTVITGFPNYPFGREYPGYKKRLFDVEDFNGVKVIRVWLFTSGSAGVPSRLLNYLTFMFSSVMAGLIVPNVNCIVATSGPIFAGLAGCIVSTIKKVPFVFDVRDIWPERIYAGTAIQRGRAIRMLEHLELFLYRKSAAITVVTRGVKENILSKGVSSDKVSLITNGVNTTIFFPKTKDPVLASNLGIGENKFVVIYAGTIGLLQDNDIILASAERLKDYGDILFLVIGDGAKRGEFADKVKKLQNVMLLPLVSQKELCGYINLSDVGINTNTTHPHNNMTIPVKMFPYMACRKPVVLANTGEIAELVKNYNIGRCVHPGDAEAFSNAILDFYNDRDLLKQCGENGFQLVNEKFSTDKIALHLLSVIRTAS